MRTIRRFEKKHPGKGRGRERGRGSRNLKPMEGGRFAKHGSGRDVAKTWVSYFSESSRPRITHISPDEYQTRGTTGKSNGKEATTKAKKKQTAVQERTSAVSLTDHLFGTIFYLILSWRSSSRTILHLQSVPSTRAHRQRRPSHITRQQSLTPNPARALLLGQQVRRTLQPEFNILRRSLSRHTHQRQPSHAQRRQRTTSSPCLIHQPPLHRNNTDPSRPLACRINRLLSPSLNCPILPTIPSHCRNPRPYLLMGTLSAPLTPNLARRGNMPLVM